MIRMGVLILVITVALFSDVPSASGERILTGQYRYSQNHAPDTGPDAGETDIIMHNAWSPLGDGTSAPESVQVLMTIGLCGVLGVLRHSDEGAA